MIKLPRVLNIFEDLLHFASDYSCTQGCTLSPMLTSSTPYRSYTASSPRRVGPRANANEIKAAVPKSHQHRWYGWTVASWCEVLRCFSALVAVCVVLVLEKAVVRRAGGLIAEMAALVAAQAVASRSGGFCPKRERRFRAEERKELRGGPWPRLDLTSTMDKTH